MLNNKEDISMIEILQAINDFATKIEERFNQIEERFDQLDDKINSEIDGLRQEMRQGFYYHEAWLKKIEKNMATKNQLNSLLGVLERKNVINKYEAHHVTSSDSLI